MQSDATLEVPVNSNPRCPGVPPVAVDVLKSVAVSGALYDSARLVRNRIVRGVSERAKGFVAHVHASRVNVVFSTRRAVLQIVSPTVFGHPRALNERSDRRVTMVLTESLPSVFLRIETEQPVRCPFVCEMLRLIELDDVEWIDVRRVPIEKPALGVRIVEELGIPWTWLHRVRLCKCALRLVLARHPQPWQQAIVKLDAAPFPLGHPQRMGGAGRTMPGVE